MDNKLEIKDLIKQIINISITEESICKRKEFICKFNLSPTHLLLDETLKARFIYEIGNLAMNLYVNNFEDMQFNGMKVMFVRRGKDEDKIRVAVINQNLSHSSNLPLSLQFHLSTSLVIPPFLHISIYPTISIDRYIPPTPSPHPYIYPLFPHPAHISLILLSKNLCSPH